MIEREAVLAALRAEDVADHFDIRGPWRGRWKRSRRCPTADHGTDSMALSRDGFWHCHACDTGGDLLKLIAMSSALDVRADFAKVLELAAAIAGVVDDDDFGGGGKPAKPERAPAPEQPPTAKRLDTARARAAWAWARLMPADRTVAAYLRGRGLDADFVMKAEELRCAPINVSSAELQRASSKDLESFVKMFRTPGIALPVRSPIDGALVDIRVRRYDPEPDRPKIIGMLGGFVRERGDLHGCYGRPNEIDRDVVVVCEGAFDYLTALQIWPKANVLGATDAGALPYVARHAAAALASNGGGTVIIVAQNDDNSTDEEWRAKMDPTKRSDGAADRSVDEATKNVIAILGANGVAWCECRPHKDLNDRHRAGDAIDIIAPAIIEPEMDFG